MKQNPQFCMTSTYTYSDCRWQAKFHAVQIFLKQALLRN